MDVAASIAWPHEAVQYLLLRLCNHVVCEPFVLAWFMLLTLCPLEPSWSYVLPQDALPGPDQGPLRVSFQQGASLAWATHQFAV